MNSKRERVSLTFPAFYADFFPLAQSVFLRDPESVKFYKTINIFFAREPPRALTNLLFSAPDRQRRGEDFSLIPYTAIENLNLNFVSSKIFQPRNLRRKSSNL